MEYLEDCLREMKECTDVEDLVSYWGLVHDKPDTIELAMQRGYKLHPRPYGKLGGMISLAKDAMRLGSRKCFTFICEHEKFPKPALTVLAIDAAEHECEWGLTYLCAKDNIAASMAMMTAIQHDRVYFLRNILDKFGSMVTLEEAAFIAINSDSLKSLCYICDERGYHPSEKCMAYARKNTHPKPLMKYLKLQYNKET